MTNLPFNIHELPNIGMLQMDRPIPDLAPFRQAAAYFEEHGHYPHFKEKRRAKLDLREGSDFRVYWDEERRRCRQGLTINGYYMNKYLYFHLNYGRIWLLDYTEEEKQMIRDGKPVSTERVYGFPSVWDSNVHFINYLAEAKVQAMHGLVFKSRGVGASYIFSSMANCEYYHTPGAKVFFLAPIETQLIGLDATLSRVWEHMDWLEMHTPFYKIRSGAGTNRDMIRRSKADTKVQGKAANRDATKVSSIAGIVVRDAKKFRGPRGNIIFLDEGGANKNITKIFNTARRSVEQGQGSSYGFIVIAGTGGTSLEDLAGFSDMAMNPIIYNILGVPNVFSKVPTRKPIALFIGAYWNRSGYTNALGRSDLIGAMEKELSIRKVMANHAGKTSETYLHYCSENALYPEEALQNVISSGLPIELLTMQKDELESNPPTLHIGRMDLKELHTSTFIPDATLEAFNIFPTMKGKFYKGAVVIHEMPIESHNYGIGIDPYAQDASTTTSHGACYVWDLDADCLVASYIGRPETSEMYLRQCIAIARFYNNAKTLVENDLTEFKSIYKLYQAVDLLAPTPKVILELLPKGTSVATRKYGSSHNEKLYNTTLNWFVDYIKSNIPLSTELYITTIWDLGLIREVALSNEKKMNFDRLNALSLVMQLRQEYLTSKAIRMPEPVVDNEFEELLAHIRNL